MDRRNSGRSGYLPAPGWAPPATSTYTYGWRSSQLRHHGFRYFWPTEKSSRPLTRHVVAIAQMLMSALLIHLTGGRIETHFHVFGSLAFWPIIAIGALIPATMS